MITSGFLMSLFDLLFSSVGRYDRQKCVGRKKSMMNKKCFDIILICNYGNLILNIIWYDFVIMIGYRYKMIPVTSTIINIWGDGRAVNCIRL